MHFIDSIGALELVRLIARQQSAFARRFSLSARFLRLLLTKIGVCIPEIRRLEIGDVNCATGIRQVAYERAERCVETKPWRSWADSLSKELSINIAQLVEKYLFEECYDEFLFAGLVVAYVREHKEEVHACAIGPDAARIYSTEFSSAENCKVQPAIESPTFAFVSALMVGLPAVLLYFTLLAARSRGQKTDNAVICLVDAPSTFFMMEQLFGREPHVRFFVEKAYVRYFPEGFLVSHGVGILGVNARAYFRCLAATPALIWTTLWQWRQLAPYGALPVTILHLLLKAAQLTPAGRNVCVITTEHLTLPRSARNELLRSEGSSTIYVSKNSYVTYQQLPTERLLNYDVFCAAGAHAIDLYAKKKSATETFLKTGAYDAHRELSDDVSRDSRLELLEKFRGRDSLIVFLSPGICDETHSNERRLMQLAKKVSELPGVKVLLRKKPGAPPPGYESFYLDTLGENSLVWETGGEFDLFDFVGRADLFVTSISTSACDVSLRGGAVMFVDFMGTPDLYLPWVHVPEIVVSEKNAYEKIADWLKSPRGTASRKRHSQACLEFSRYVGWRCGSFIEYRDNLIAHVRPWIDRATVNTVSQGASDIVFRRDK